MRPKKKNGKKKNSLFPSFHDQFLIRGKVTNVTNSKDQNMRKTHNKTNSGRSVKMNERESSHHCPAHMKPSEQGSPLDPNLTNQTLKQMRNEAMETQLLNPPEKRR